MSSPDQPQGTSISQCWNCSRFGLSQKIKSILIKGHRPSGNPTIVPRAIYRSALKRRALCTNDCLSGAAPNSLSGFQLIINFQESVRQSENFKIFVFLCSVTVRATGNDHVPRDDYRPASHARRFMTVWREATRCSQQMPIG